MAGDALRFEMSFPQKAFKPLNLLHLTLSRVSTEMDIPFLYSIKPPRPTQPGIPQSVGKMRTGNGQWLRPSLGEKNSEFRA